jgi:four helix bundle protein
MNKIELEERLVEFAVLIIEIINELPSSKAGNHISGQLLRSGTSPSLNYAESRSAESLKDFIHKLQIALKELRESHVCLRIIDKSKLHENETKISTVLKECDELISIFVKSVQTAHKRKLNQK